MSLLELLLVSIIFTFFLIGSLGYGSYLTSLFHLKLSRWYFGGYLILGMGVISNIGLILGILGIFNKSYILSAVLLGGLLNIAVFKKNKFKIANIIKRSILCAKNDWLASALLIFCLALCGTIYLSAMQPPHASDELHYHFPQARNIAESHKINWSFDDHYFYGNIPKLIDIIFAEGLSVYGYELAHLLNFLFLLGFIGLVFGTMTKRYGYRSATFTILILLLFEDYTWNATVGFVDSATSSLEIGSLLLLAIWVTKRTQGLLAFSGLLIGLSLAAKYSPLPTALYMTMIIIFRSKDRRLDNLLLFASSAFFVGGYWYIKNWIIFGNPFYPMYFGHRGITEETYRILMNAIWQWEPKTLSVFIQKIGHWKTYSEAATYISIWMAPISFFLFRKDVFIRIFSIFYLLYVPYWFLLATHQTRFLLTGIIVAIILVGIMISRLQNNLLIALITILVVAGLVIRPYPDRNLIEHFLWIKLHTVERQYSLGNISEKEYLHREFGCQYDIVRYLSDQNLEGEVVDNWSLYKSPSVSYFSKNRFIGNNMTIDSLDDYEYYYSRESVISSFLADNTEEYFTDRHKPYLDVEEYVRINWELLTQIDDCRLYVRLK